MASAGRCWEHHTSPTLHVRPQTSPQGLEGPPRTSHSITAWGEFLHFPCRSCCCQTHADNLGAVSGAQTEALPPLLAPGSISPIHNKAALLSPLSPLEKRGQTREGLQPSGRSSTGLCSSEPLPALPQLGASASTIPGTAEPPTPHPCLKFASQILCRQHTLCFKPPDSLTAPCSHLLSHLCSNTPQQQQH